MVDQNDLFKALGNAAQIEAAKHGGYSPVDMNSLTANKGGKFGGLMDIVLPMYAAATNAPAARMLLAGRHALNLRQYNKQHQQQGLYALQQGRIKDANNAEIYNKRTGMNVQGPFDATIANDAATDIRSDNAKPSINRHLAGEALELDSYADYDPAMVRATLEQQGKVANFQNRGAGLGAIADGQTQSLIKQALMKMSGGPIGGLQEGTMDTSQPGSITTGISKVAPPQYIQDGVSPHVMPTDVPSGIGSLMRAGLDDAQAKGSLDEDARQFNLGHTLDQAKNKREEEELRLKRAGNYFKHYPPTGGGSQNPYTIPNAAQNFVQGQVNAIDQELKSLGYIGEGGKLKSVPANSPPGLFGLGGYNQTPQDQRAQQLIQMRSQLQSQILPGGGAPFRNTSGTKLKQASRIKGKKGTYDIPD